MSGSAIFQMAEAGIRSATMTYEEGGKFERWTWNNISVRVPGGTQQDEIKRQLVEKAKGTDPESK